LKLSPVRLEVRLAAILLLVLVACAPDPIPVQPSEPGWVWSKTFGGAGNDYANAVAVDAQGGVYVAGSSDASFGWTNAGLDDAFLRKFDAQGSSLWTNTIATVGKDKISDLAVTADQQIIAVGSSDGPNGNGSNLADAVLQSWTVNGIAGPGLRFGSPKADAAVAVAVAGNDAVIVGWTDAAITGTDANPQARDAFVTRLSLNAAGQNSLGLWKTVWTRQLSCSDDCEASGVAFDPDGNVYVTGFSFGDIGTAKVSQASDAFVAKFAADGTPLWQRLIGGNGEDIANAIAADSSGAYLVGYTNGAMADQSGSGLDDAFIARLNPDGQTQWVRFLGTTQADAAVDIAINSSGAQLVGYSEGSLPGQASAGKADAFLAGYDANGTRTSLVTLGGAGNDYANGISLARNANLEPNGSLYIAGYTEATLPGNSSAGFIDAFVARYGPLP
jgi:Beta-propeller repeat